MKAKATVAAVALMVVGFASTATAQFVRNGDDVIWARDIQGAQMTLDGQLNEPVWQLAETIELDWNNIPPGIGSGQRTDGNFVLLEPSDPNDGTVYILRDGNTIWLAAEVRDKSIGGVRTLDTGFRFDGLIMNILDRTRLMNNRLNPNGFLEPRYFQGNRTEFFLSWWNGKDTTSATSTYANGELIGARQPLPGIPPRMHGFYGQPNNAGVFAPRDPAMEAIWDSETVVDGIANDDTHGEDQGYTMEMRIDASALGYNFTQTGGDKLAWNIALNDADYYWPVNANIQYLSRVWWQNQWGNNFNEGAAYIYGDPTVTVSSVVPEVTEPEFTVPNAEVYPEPEIDGSLDERVWEVVDPAFQMQYQPDPSTLEENPEIMKYYHFFWRPGTVPPDPAAAIVVDPSIARFKMFFKDDILYLGIDVDDQAVSGAPMEDGMDGVYFFLRDRDSLHASGSSIGTPVTRRFDFSVDSTGAVRLGSDARTVAEADPTAIRAAASLKGESTAADPNDVDEGYQIEVAFDLPKVLGYPAGLGDHRLWTSATFLDGDFLPSESDSYTMRTWITSERGGGVGAAVYGLMDVEAMIGVGTEAGAEIPQNIELLGNYPNPFNPATTLRYALPQAGSVSIQIFDALGRAVTQLKPGNQTAGRHELAVSGNSLSSGVYFYRIQLQNTAGDNFVSSVGQFILVK